MCVYVYVSMYVCACVCVCVCVFVCVCMNACVCLSCIVEETVTIWDVFPPGYSTSQALISSCSVCLSAQGLADMKDKLKVLSVPTTTALVHNLSAIHGMPKHFLLLLQTYIGRYQQVWVVSRVNFVFLLSRFSSSLFYLSFLYYSTLPFIFYLNFSFSLGRLYLCILLKADTVGPPATAGIQ